jgi:hypothetical protein
MQFSNIDKSSVKLTIDTTGSKPDLFVVTNVPTGSHPFAHLHLTRGANQTGNGQLFGNAIKVTANVDLLLGPSDSQDWSFNFLQFGNLMVRSALWGGRTPSEGSVLNNYAIAPAFPTNPSLDSTAQFDPFVNLLSSPQTSTPEGNLTRVALTREMGDHPNSKNVLEVPNTVTNSPNFLYNLRLDVGFTTVFVAREPNNTIHALKHFTWHVIYDAKFTWKGGTCTGVMSNGRFDIGPITDGAPTDPTLQTLLKTPKKPYYNKLCEAASNTILNSPAAPNVTESATRDQSIPASFYT